MTAHCPRSIQGVGSYSQYTGVGSKPARETMVRLQPDTSKNRRFYGRVARR
jgi:hypothetical protein